MPARAKRVFVSDVHIGMGEQWDWLNPVRKAAFQSFLKDINDNRADVKEVILLGDIFDNWVCPHDVAPRSFEQIMNAQCNQGVMSELARLASNKDMKLLYIPGNHDMGIADELPALRAKCPGIRFDSGKGVFTAGGITATHGHIYSLFNAQDESKKYKYPIGYYMSRALASKKGGGARDISFWRGVIAAKEAIGAKKLHISVFDAMCDEAGLKHGDEITMPDGQKEKISAIRETYAGIQEEWANREAVEGLTSVNMAICSEIDNFRAVAFNITCRRSGGPRVLILGHSHSPYFACEANTTVYANTGSWCESAAMTFMETEKESGTITVTRRMWNDTRKKAEDYLPGIVDNG